MPTAQPDRLDGLTELERQHYHGIAAWRGSDRITAEQDLEAEATLEAEAALEALEELAAYRRDDTLVGVRRRLRVTLERLSRIAIDGTDDTGRLDGPHVYSVVHALTAAACAYTTLGGNLELEAAMPNTDALEAEARVAELEAAIDALIDAVKDLGPQAELLLEGAAEHVGLAIRGLGQARHA